MKKLLNTKWFRAAIPALLIHCSIGTVYCWSQIKGEIAEAIGYGTNVAPLEWAFSLAIFFLGMSAAFGGNIVEKNIHKSSLISAVCFTVGMVGTGICVYFKSLPGIFLFYGVIMGIGLGFGYLSPVKTLMLWFKEQKGLATGLAVAGFGLAKMIASPIMASLISNFGVVNMFYILAVIYFIMMFCGHLLLKKPDGWVEEPHKKSDAKVTEVFKNKTFIGIWLMFFLNITCGLAIISQEKYIYAAAGIGAAMITFLCSMTALFNAFGRIAFSAAADNLKDRNTIYKLIFILSAGFSVITFVTNGIASQLVFLVVVLLCIINAGYGGGFSNLPTLLSDRFGMKTISAVHGLALSAWAFAGIAGNQLSTLILNMTGQSYNHVLYVTAALYAVALIVSFVLVKPGKVE